MLRVINILTSVIVTITFVHTAILIGGGRGPFALNGSYWACHCPDSPNDDSVQSSVSPSQLFHRPLTASAKLQTTQDFELDQSEICKVHYTPVSLQGKVCKKKLPLRYTGMLLSNVVVIYAPLSAILHKFITSHSEILAERDATFPAGYLSDLLRPPRA